ncbi:MAG: hypothetical protein IJA10_02710 [Lachnospiraceae bacterium]|nr:hypothetical protein [Lachnospiraceae bacterium]
MKKFLCVIIILALTVGFGMGNEVNICYAEDENKDLVILSEEVPAEIDEYLETMAPYIIYDVISNSIWKQIFV